MFKIAVLASTNGTDLQAIIDEMKAGKMEGIELTCVLSYKECKAIERAKEAGYDARVLGSKFDSREKFEIAAKNILKEKGVDLVCLIGYMRILSDWFIDEFDMKIINVHPAIDMEKYGGEGFFGGNVHKAVLEAGEKETGCTIHYVTKEVDAGPPIDSEEVEILPNDTVGTLKDKVQACEKRLYPEVIRKIAKGEYVMKLRL
ncbi:phosphoribosylglycinamide formyltransferase [Patescibacteria group bacterium]